MMDLWDVTSRVFVLYNVGAAAVVGAKPELLVRRPDRKTRNVLAAYALKHAALGVMGALFLVNAGWVPDEYTLAVGLFHLAVLATSFARDGRLSRLVIFSHGSLVALFLMALAQRKAW